LSYEGFGTLLISFPPNEKTSYVLLFKVFSCKPKWNMIRAEKTGFLAVAIQKGIGIVSVADDSYIRGKTTQSAYNLVLKTDKAIILVSQSNTESL
jgi:hypothetical protein